MRDSLTLERQDCMTAKRLSPRTNTSLMLARPFKCHRTSGKFLNLSVPLFSF